MNKILSFNKRFWLVFSCLLFVLGVSTVNVRQASASRWLPNSLVLNIDDKLKVVGHPGQNPSPSPSPTPSPSDIFLVDVATENGQIKFGKPVRITDWAGYNNQPFFLPTARS